MRLKIKKITLKEDTERDIAQGVTDKKIAKYIRYIRTHLEKANMLINNKMEEFTDIELYNALKEVFNIIIEPKDYLRILSKMYDRHYIRFININTNMMDNEENISYMGVVTSKYEYLDGSRVDLKTLRKMTSNYEFLAIQTIKEKEDVTLKAKEQLENHQFIDVDINAWQIDENSELFPYTINFLAKEIRIKDILFELKWYVKEIIHQARCITDLAKLDDKDKMKIIGIRYKKALDKAFNEREIPKREKISVRKHKKIKVKTNSNK